MHAMGTSCKSIEWVTDRRAIELGVATKVEREGVDLFGPRQMREAAKPDPPHPRD
jgi:hypothetical protein